MAAPKKQQSKAKTFGLVAIILVLALLIPIGLFLGAATLFTYANFNSENARMDARYNAEVQLNSIEGTTGSVVIENLGGTPPTKKSLLVNLYVDQVPEGIILTNMVKFAFERTWKGYDAFKPDDITVQILNKEKPKDAKNDTQALSNGLKVIQSVKKDLPWITGSSSSGFITVSSKVLQEQFGPNGRDE